METCSALKIIEIFKKFQQIYNTPIINFIIFVRSRLTTNQNNEESKKLLEYLSDKFKGIFNI